MNETQCYGLLYHNKANDVVRWLVRLKIMVKANQVEFRANLGNYQLSNYFSIYLKIIIYVQNFNVKR